MPRDYKQFAIEWCLCIALACLIVIVLTVVVGCGGGDPEDQRATTQPVDCTIPGACK